ncbi:hypothetical protein GCM10011521_01200 [Arenimonas soli]|uniref:Glycosyltransferase 2-like domain-containing protein n=1 Tax=Arenimonas soli TaxID=2269504 RepID=A0ABQ1HBA7_9GAMM|nr:glycosyltransferase family A protein [Arenimonas soli]GGA66839.1 hypothetical protein GCM10011521_01200 [Arenimonas soli]
MTTGTAALNSTSPAVVRSPQFERPAGEGLAAPACTLPEEPLVSVVMTSFNSAPWLPAAAQSVLAQSWSRLELVLVDDASTDDSLDIALRLADADSRVRVFAMDRNSGTYAAKNAGMAGAHGEVITFMDSDDAIDPERIARQLALLRRPGLVATTCNYVRRTAAGELVLNRGLAERQALISLMIKRQVVDEVGWFDAVRTSADDEYFERIRHSYGRQAHANVAEPLYVALHRESSLSTSNATGTRMQAENAEDFLSAPRRAYVEAYRAWYATLAAEGLRPCMPRHVGPLRPFPVHPAVAGTPHPGGG